MNWMPNELNFSGAEFGRTELKELCELKCIFWGDSTNFNIYLEAPCEEQAPQLWLGNLKPLLIRVYPALALFYDLRRAVFLTLRRILKLQSARVLWRFAEWRIKENKLISKIIDMEKSKLSQEKAEITSQVFKVYKKHTICTFFKCLDRLLFFPQPQFLLNISVLWIQTRTIKPEVSYETYVRCMNCKIWL